MATMHLGDLVLDALHDHCDGRLRSWLGVAVRHLVIDIGTVSSDDLPHFQCTICVGGDGQLHVVWAGTATLFNPEGGRMGWPLNDERCFDLALAYVNDAADRVMTKHRQARETAWAIREL
jgi:hypothetical protein